MTALLLWGLCACQAPTQVLVTVTAEQALWSALSRVEVESLDRDGRVHGKTGSFATRGEKAVTNGFSFGALPAAGTSLWLRVRGYGSDAIVIEQQLKLTLAEEHTVAVDLLLRESCSRSVCGEQA